jgi:hypothetical protein
MVIAGAPVLQALLLAGRHHRWIRIRERTDAVASTTYPLMRRRP